MASSNKDTYGSIDVQKWLGYLTIDEYKVLRTYAVLLSSGSTIVNIGAGAGTSGLMFAEVTGTSGFVYTVDIQEESNPHGCLQGERVVFEKAGLMHLKDKHWFQIHGDSKLVGKAWKGPGIDLLFIDGDHSYAGCAGDILSWYDNVKVGGIIAIHDYEETHPMKKQVYETTNELLLGIMNVEELVDCMIVLRKISDAPISK